MDTPQGTASLTKPGLLEATAILTLISAIVHLVGFAGIFFWLLLAGLATFGLACFLLSLAFLPLVMAFFELRYALALLANPIRVSEPNKILAIVQVCLILCGNVVALAAGVVALVAYSDEAVLRYFAARSG